MIGKKKRKMPHVRENRSIRICGTDMCNTFFSPPPPSLFVVYTIYSYLNLRLMEIMNGGNITPEDFELLLQLDENNTKKTLDCNAIKDFDVISVGECLSSSKDGISFFHARCTICLDPFKDMQREFELRKLPCGHMFCK
jgi:hypothetical protein